MKTLFGRKCKNTQGIDLVIKLEEWSRDKDYDRFGLDEQHIEILGNKVVCYRFHPSRQESGHYL